MASGSDFSQAIRAALASLEIQLDDRKRALEASSRTPINMCKALQLLREKADLSAVCTCLDDIRLYSDPQSLGDDSTSWRVMMRNPSGGPVDRRDPAWGLNVAKWESYTRKKAATVVEGSGYIALFLAAFDAVFDSNQELRDLAGHTPLREVLRTQLLPTRIKVMKAQLVKELDIVISAAFAPVYRQHRPPEASLIGSVNTRVNDVVVGVVIKQVFDSFVLTPLDLPASLTQLFQQEEQQHQQEQQQQLAADRRTLNNALNSIGNSWQSLSEAMPLGRDHSDSGDEPAQVENSDIATSISSVDSSLGLGL